LGGVVLQEIGEVIRRNEIVHRHHVHRRAEKALFCDGPKDQAPDASEPIDTDFCHSRFVSVGSLADKETIAKQKLGRWPFTSTENGKES